MASHPGYHGVEEEAGGFVVRFTFDGATHTLTYNRDQAAAGAYDVLLLKAACLAGLRAEDAERECNFSLQTYGWDAATAQEMAGSTFQQVVEQAAVLAVSHSVVAVAGGCEAVGAAGGGGGSGGVGGAGGGGRGTRAE